MNVGTEIQVIYWKKCGNKNMFIIPMNARCCIPGVYPHAYNAFPDGDCVDYAHFQQN